MVEVPIFKLNSDEKMCSEHQYVFWVDAENHLET